MNNKIAIGGLWSQAQSWKDSTVPTGGPKLIIRISPGATSTDDLGRFSIAQPFQADVLKLDGTAADPSTLILAGGDLQVADLIGGAWGNQNEVVVGLHAADQHSVDFPNLVVTTDAINVNFTIEGGGASRVSTFDPGTVTIGYRVDGDTFNLTSTGGAAATLVLEHPPLWFMPNEIDVNAFPSPELFMPGSGPERIELAGIKFDRADFVACGQTVSESTQTGVVILSERGVPVYGLLNVHASGYNSSAGGYFSVGTDPVTDNNYVQYSRL